MRVHSFFAALILSLWALCLGSRATAQEPKDIIAEGQVKIGVHKFKLDEGLLYVLEVKGKDFTPGVNMTAHYIPNTADFNKDRNTFRGTFMLTKSGEHVLTVQPGGFLASPPEGLLDYTLTLKAMQFEKSPLLTKKDSLTANDPKYQQSFRNTPHKAYPLMLKQGQMVVIEMVREGKSKELDPYLYIEHPNKAIAAHDDDSAGSLNARIVFTAPKDGNYRVIATGLAEQRSLGDYTLTVRNVLLRK